MAEAIEITGIEKDEWGVKGNGDTGHFVNDVDGESGESARPRESLAALGATIEELRSLLLGWACRVRTVSAWAAQQEQKWQSEQAEQAEKAKSAQMGDDGEKEEQEEGEDSEEVSEGDGGLRFVTSMEDLMTRAERSRGMGTRHGNGRMGARIEYECSFTNLNQANTRLLHSSSSSSSSSSLSRPRRSSMVSGVSCGHCKAYCFATAVACRCCFAVGCSPAHAALQCTKNKCEEATIAMLERKQDPDISHRDDQQEIAEWSPNEADRTAVDSGVGSWEDNPNIGLGPCYDFASRFPFSHGCLLLRALEAKKAAIFTWKQKCSETIPASFDQSKVKTASPPDLALRWTGLPRLDDVAALAKEAKRLHLHESSLDNDGERTSTSRPTGSCDSTALDGVRGDTQAIACIEIAHSALSWQRRARRLLAVARAHRASVSRKRRKNGRPKAQHGQRSTSSRGDSGAPVGWNEAASLLWEAFGGGWGDEVSATKASMREPCGSTRTAPLLPPLQVQVNPQDLQQVALELVLPACRARLALRRAMDQAAAELRQTNECASSGHGHTGGGGGGNANDLAPSAPGDKVVKGQVRDIDGFSVDREEDDSIHTLETCARAAASAAANTLPLRQRETSMRHHDINEIRDGAEDIAFKSMESDPDSDDGDLEQGMPAETNGVTAVVNRALAKAQHCPVQIHEIDLCCSWLESALVGNKTD